MATTAEQIRSFRGPAVLSYGFRPFFLGGAVWAALAIAIWLPLREGRFALPIAFSAVDWHAHEMLYGFVPAIVAGFLLTAVPNWTGRLPVTGGPLFALFLTWVAGRVAMLVAQPLGPLLAAVVDLAFLVGLGAVVAREIVAARNLHNLKVLGGVGLLLAGNAVFHIEALSGRGDGYGSRIGVAATVLLIMLIGGRIIPSFTRNWLVRRETGRLPVAFNRLDAGIMAVSGLALAAWIGAPQHALTAVLAFAAGLANAVRLARWAGDRTAAEPLVAILHVAYAFVPVGFLLGAAAIAAPAAVAASGAVHGWTAGATGLMTLAVMTRASLGHTGRPLVSTRPIRLVYLVAIVAALARIGPAFDVAREPLLHLSAAAWVLAFAGFAWVYAPLLLRPRA